MLTNLLLNCWDWSGAKECTSCRSRKMLQNEYLLAKIGVDTAENEPDVEVWSISFTCTSCVEPRPAAHRRSPGCPRRKCLWAVYFNELRQIQQLRRGGRSSFGLAACLPTRSPFVLPILQNYLKCHFKNLKIAINTLNSCSYLRSLAMPTKFGLNFGEK